MDDVWALTEVLTGFTTVLVASPTTDRVLEELTASVTGLLSLAGSGVSVLADGRLRHIATSPGPAAELEQCQEQWQQGPGCDATASGETVCCADVREQHVRWPSYAARAETIGIAGAASVSMNLDDETVGALCLYAAEPRTWSGDELGAAKVFANIAAFYLITASKLEQQQRLSTQLRHALDSRIVIEQAKGIIAAERHTSIDEAFTLMRGHARSRSRSIQEIAGAIVEGVFRP
ncbi:GAF and ANTAR domain-containing protein [Rhodococcus sp. D2-41]|uniref:GAF and ANTAR domain-containing protein n=1 Tax=Speluncibacter jeojiensis TaxID=2710754 RepID=A0A9X4RFN2_9ACTN|nr:GAF and ANTAR domain-containing protein [Rhodococcus sp. D2-41]MDG3009534.1 GAF and ANTAR domain-containing protein [Rhodococcus sp. D2-41]MDG3016462.1 GAF and ANTAR domain-containing protein [Corynebacteriales bacterium D3-21]